MRGGARAILACALIGAVVHVGAAAETWSVYTDCPEACETRYDVAAGMRAAPLDGVASGAPKLLAEQGCAAADFAGAAGAVVIVDAGDCSDEDKAVNAAASGVAALLVVNTVEFPVGEADPTIPYGRVEPATALAVRNAPRLDMSSRDLTSCAVECAADEDCDLLTGVCVASGSASAAGSGSSSSGSSGDGSGGSGGAGSGSASGASGSGSAAGGSGSGTASGSGGGSGASGDGSASSSGSSAASDSGSSGSDSAGSGGSGSASGSGGGSNSGSGSDSGSGSGALCPPVDGMDTPDAPSGASSGDDGGVFGLSAATAAVTLLVLCVVVGMWWRRRLAADPFVELDADARRRGGGRQGGEGETVELTVASDSDDETRL